MSDNFIPINHSTPVRGIGSPRWQQGTNQNQRNYYNNRYQNSNGERRGGYNNKWGNKSRNSSTGTDTNNSYGQDNKNSIDAYLHPSMLQDPWASLRQRNKE